MHEAVHGMFHSSVRSMIGRLRAAAFFPTIFPVQRLSHMTHHKEQSNPAWRRFDYYEADDFHFLKVAQWYSILTGLYWLFIPVFCHGLCVVWHLILGKACGDCARWEDKQVPSLISIAAADPDVAKSGWICTHIVCSGADVWGLDISLWGWVACYAHSV